MTIHRSCSSCGSGYFGPVECPRCAGTGIPQPSSGATWLRRELLRRNPEVVLLEGLDKALVGYAQLGGDTVALYCRRLVFNTLLNGGVPHDLLAATMHQVDKRTNPNAPLIVDLNESEDEQLRLV